MQKSRFAHLTAAEYLASEAESPRKREYVDGMVYAMAGASRQHNLLAANILAAAVDAAKRKPACQTFGSDMKVHVQARNSFYYPDISASCDPDDREEFYLERPCSIVEVLSPSTATIDRREKRTSYEQLSSLREYVIVYQHDMRVEVYRRGTAGWQGDLLSQPEDVVESSCLGLRLTLKQIYDGVDLSLGLAEERAEYGIDD